MAVHSVIVAAKVPALEKQRAKPPLIEVPVAHRSGVDVQEPGPWVPADTATLHRPRCPHRGGEPRSEMNIERATIEVLAILGHPERRARQHRIGLGRPIGGEDARALGINRIHDRGEEIDDRDINLDRGGGMKVAQ